MTAVHPTARVGADDQAARLRALVEQAAHAPAPPPPLAPDRRDLKILTIASGKGGVGKTNLSVNLAAACAQAGHRACLIDADLGLANADVLCGVNTASHLGQVLDGRCAISDIAVDAPSGFRLVSGASGIVRLAHLDEPQRVRIIHALAELQSDTDLLIVDCGAGIGRGVLAFLDAADLSLIVTTPEPTAVADAYALIKAILTRRGADAAPRFSLVVNQASSEREAQAVHRRIDSVTRHFLDHTLSLAGWVHADPVVPAAVRRRTPFLLSNPRSRAASDVRKIAGEITRDIGARGGAPRKRPNLLRQLLEALGPSDESV